MASSQEFVKESIKNDLRRVSKWALEAKGSLPIPKMRTFLQHAQKEAAQLIHLDKSWQTEIAQLSRKMGKTSDPLERIRWAEKVLTLSCRL